jgi:hypothetical protein
MAPAWWGAAFGQDRRLSVISPTSSLQGTISAISNNGPGGSLAGANVNLTPAGSPESRRSTVTNDQGEYKSVDLPAGEYTLQVSLSGFKQHTENVIVRGVTIQSIGLEVEGVSGRVTVVVGGDDLKTTDTAPASTFNQKHLATLPLVNERFEDAIPFRLGHVTESRDRFPLMWFEECTTNNKQFPVQTL